jgi:ABC-type dipeptide/oligopeptide/nickel transport system permease component
MLTYIVRRLLLLVPVLIGVSLLTFAITRMAGPGYTIYLDPNKPATPEVIEQIKEKYHLDEPIYIQYYYWLDGALHGDLGISKTAKVNVTTAISQKFPATFELAVVATFFSVLLGVTVGTRAGVKANSFFDQGSRLVALIGVSIPVFWLGILLSMVFYKGLGLPTEGWLPGYGRYNYVEFSYSHLHHWTNLLTVDTLLNGKFSFFWDAVKHLLLPALTLCFVQTAIIIRMMRSSMLEVLGAEYVKTARSKGLPENVVIKKHARRNALIPTTTVIGLGFGGLLGGAVLTETLFAFPGIGQWSAQAAIGLDSAGIMGFTLLTAVIYVIANLIVDLIYAYLDPRVRLG